MTDRSIIDKIAKLLALAGNNPNEHEAASAAAKAQALMQEHDLAAADIDMTQDARVAGIGRSERIVLAKAGKPGGWKVDLFTTVGQTSDCWVTARRARKGWDATGTMIGAKQDVEVAHYVFDYLVAELERLQQEYGRTRWDELREYARVNGFTTHEAETDFSEQRRHPLKAKNDWIKGAVAAVIETLHERKRERDGQTEQTRALIVNKEAAIKEWWAQEQGYASYADYQASFAKPTASEPDTRTPRQREKDAEKADRRWRRMYERDQRRREKELAELDHEAFEAGRQTGARITVRPGVEG